MPIGLPMKGMRRNDDAMKNKCRYHKNKFAFIVENDQASTFSTSFNAE